MARPAAESRHGGYMFCFRFFYLFILTIPFIPIKLISKSFLPIFSKFLGLVELRRR